MRAGGLGGVDGVGRQNFRLAAVLRGGRASVDGCRSHPPWQQTSVETQPEHVDADAEESPVLCKATLTRSMTVRLPRATDDLHDS